MAARGTTIATYIVGNLVKRGSLGVEERTLYVDGGKSDTMTR